MKKFTLWLFVLFACWQLNAQTGTVIVGVDDGTPNTTTGYPSPLQDYYKTGRAQYLYLASELSAAGLVAGPITELGWVVTSIGVSTLEEGYKISMKSTTSTVLTSTFETGASVVYGPTDFTPSATGNNMFTLSTPFIWDGTSNIIVEVCGGVSTGTYTENVRCANSTLTFNGSAYFYSDTEASPCTIATIPTFNGGVSTSRPLLVAVGNLASCLAPLNLVSSGITSNSANVSWDPSTSGLASGYEYSVSTSSTAPTGSGTATTNVYALLSSLLPNTTYYLFVRTNCGGSFSGWAGPISFTTACVAVNTYPFLETFNTDSTSKACWSVINGNADANSWSLNGTTIPRSGQSAQLYTDYATSNNDYLVSPQFNLGATPKRLKFWVRHYSNGEPDNLEVKISTGGKTIPDFTTTLLSLSTTQITTTYTEYIVDLTPYTGLVYIAFARENAPADGWYIAVDDVTVENIPTCTEPSGLVSSSITANTANVSWDSPTSAPALGYQYVLSTTNTPPTGTGTTVSTSYVVLNSLTANTTYYFFVRSYCSSSDSSPWIGPISFTTACNAVNTYPFLETFNTDSTSKACWSVINGNADANSWSLNGTTIPRSGQSAQLYTDYATSNNDYLVSPQFNLGTTPKRLKFWVRHYSNGEPDNLEVKISTGGKTIPDFTTTLLSLSTTQVTTTYTEYIIDLTPYTGLVYIAFARENAPADGWYIAVDDVTVENIPTCTEPSGLVSSSITAYTANISWNAPTSAPALGYQYVLSTANTPPTGTGTTVSNSYVALSSLTPSTTYYFFVRSYCSSSDSSPWIGPISFTTSCVEVTSFIQNFDTVTVPSFPNCWYKVGTTGTAYTQSSSSSSSPNCLYIYGSSATNKAVVSMIPVSNLGAGTHRFKFKMRANFTVGGILELGYLTDPTDSNSFVALTSFTASSLTYANYVYNVPAGTYSSYPAFRHTGSPANSMLVDDVIWEAMPNCPDQTGLIVSGITVSGANTSWDDMSSLGAIGYEYAVTTSATPPVSGTATTATFYPASGLSPQTVYYLHVRTTCSGGNYGNWLTISFSTACSSENIPYTQNFESATTPNLPNCTSQQNAGSGNLWTVQNNPGYGFATKALVYSYNSSNAANVWFFTNGLNLVGGSTYKISYDYGSTGSTFPERLKVAYGTSASASAMTNALADHPNVVNSTPINNIVNFTAPTTGVYYFGFNAYSTPDQFYLIVDNIVVDVALSSDSFDTTNFVAYPNPVKDVLNLSYSSTITNVKVTNLLGQQVINKNVNDTNVQVSMADLAVGTYIVNVTSGDMIHTIKVVKQ